MQASYPWPMLEMIAFSVLDKQQSPRNTLLIIREDIRRMECEHFYYDDLRAIFFRKSKAELESIWNTVPPLAVFQTRGHHSVSSAGPSPYAASSIGLIQHCIWVQVAQCLESHRRSEGRLCAREIFKRKIAWRTS